jgi:hypothetical protein
MSKDDDQPLGMSDSVEIVFNFSLMTSLAHTFTYACSYIDKQEVKDIRLKNNKKEFIIVDRRKGHFFQTIFQNFNMYICM